MYQGPAVVPAQTAALPTKIFLERCVTNQNDKNSKNVFLDPMFLNVIGVNQVVYALKADPALRDGTSNVTLRLLD